MARTLSGRPATLKALMGSGDRIGLFTAPFLVVGLILNLVYPAVFAVGGPPPVLRAVSVAVLVVGVVIWAWSVALIVVNVPRGRLITGGPYRLVKHPLYTAVALLVLPWLGLLLDSWLGALVGVVLYVASRRYAPAEEAGLSARFGTAWQEYRDGVKLPWV
jgi:protein-S-isoprenylcysteine O-methyltransferase Ste14